MITGDYLASKLTESEKTYYHLFVRIHVGMPRVCECLQRSEEEGLGSWEQPDVDARGAKEQISSF